MYRAFDLPISALAFSGRFPRYSASMFKMDNFPGDQKLKEALSSLDTLDASEISRTWFSEIAIDVFISHSSKDSDLAKSFGAFLQQHFGLRVFIDSTVWLHMDEMLRALDNKYCVSERNADNTIKTYSYDARNVTTSHVHMILAHALIKMIDNAECFIYLNTSNSTSKQAATSIDTASPWLYHELAMVNVITPKKPPLVFEKVAFDAADNRSYGPTLNYSTSTSRLISTSLDDMKTWSNQYRVGMKIRSPLDVFYNFYEDSQNGQTLVMRSLNMIKG